MDQVPVSTNEAIKVRVFEPSLLDIPTTKGNASKGGTDVQSIVGEEVVVDGYKEGSVRARWGRVNEDQDAIGAGAASGEVNTQGLMEWVCRVEANSSLDLKLGWVVTVPKDFLLQQY